jgi:hypothetical protein
MRRRRLSKRGSRRLFRRTSRSRRKNYKRVGRGGFRI